MALEDDFERQFYHPTFQCVRNAAPYADVTFGQIETTTVLANNRELAGVTPNATLAFDSTSRQSLITEPVGGTQTQMFADAEMDSDLYLYDSRLLDEAETRTFAPSMGSHLESLPNTDGHVEFASPNSMCVDCDDAGGAVDVAVYKFETGTGYVVRPLIQSDAQAVSFEFDYVYTTEIERHSAMDEFPTSRLEQRSIDTNVDLSNYELRRIRSYQVAKGQPKNQRRVPLLSKIPLAGSLFRPQLPIESSLQQNLVYAQAAIYPSLYDLLGLRWTAKLSNLESLRLSNGRHLFETHVDELPSFDPEFQNDILQQGTRLGEPEVVESLGPAIPAVPPVPNGTLE